MLQGSKILLGDIRFSGWIQDDKSHWLYKNSTWLVTIWWLFWTDLSGLLTSFLSTIEWENTSYLKKMKQGSIVSTYLLGHIKPSTQHGLLWWAFWRVWRVLFCIIFMPHLGENKLLKFSESNVIGCWMTSMVHLYLEI